MAAGAYQYAKTVAARIAERSGLTARDLYRLYGDRFAEFDCDGSSATSMIAQHLNKFEMDGLVVGEKTGKKATDPKRWIWTGPAPNGTPAKIEAIADAIQEMEPMAIDCRPEAPSPLDREPDDEPTVADASLVIDPEGELEQAIGELRTAGAVSANPGVAWDLAEKTAKSCGALRHLDVMLLAFRDACIQSSRLNIDRRDEKIAVLQRLADITAPDIAALLLNIAEDLK